MSDPTAVAQQQSMTFRAPLIKCVSSPVEARGRLLPIALQHVAPSTLADQVSAQPPLQQHPCDAAPRSLLHIGNDDLEPACHSSHCAQQGLPSSRWPQSLKQVQTGGSIFALSALLHSHRRRLKGVCRAELRTIVPPLIQLCLHHVLRQESSCISAFRAELVYLCRVCDA